MGLDVPYTAKVKKKKKSRKMFNGKKIGLF